MSTLGRSRQRLAGVLNTAFAEGLLSENTHSYRLELLFGPRLIDPQRLIGDLRLRNARSRRAAPGREAWSALRQSLRAAMGQDDAQGAALLLALDLAGSDRLLLGRDPGCDVLIEEPTVSRRHAQLTLRDGAWVIQDLDSMNGTLVNGERVGRMVVRAGDIVRLGSQAVQID